MVETVSPHNAHHGYVEKTCTCQDITFIYEPVLMYCYHLQMLCQAAVSYAVNASKIQLYNDWCNPFSRSEKYQQNTPELEIGYMEVLI
jgi:hypothetical protein